MLLLSSASFPRYGLERFFAFAKEIGFEGVEITINRNFDTQNPDYLWKLSEEYDMPIRSFSLPDTAPEGVLEAFQKTVKEFPGAHLNLSSPELFGYKYKAWLKEIAPKLAKKYHLKLNRRNAEVKTLLGFIPLRTENSLFSLKSAGAVSLDLAALGTSGQEIMRSIGYVGGKLRHVYLSNVHKGRPYAPLDMGSLPLESALTKLAQNQFEGDFTLKIHPKMLQEGKEERMREVLQQSKKFYDVYFTQVAKK